MDSKELRIAVILTCFNRKDKTLNCIESLFKYSKEFLRRKIILDVYLTDDGCTDGTSEALREKYSDSNLTILQGDGNLFWAGGMRVAWKAALDSNKSFDYFLLVNDDVEFLPNFFEQLLSAVEFGECKYNKKPVVSGILKDSETEEETYGGKVWVNKFLGTCKHLRPTGTPQKCDMAHANILLVPTYVVGKIGIFNTDYIHGGADHDYTLYANRHGIPVLVTSNYCGICNNDHRKKKERPLYVASLPYKERKEYFNNPRHSIHDHIVYTRRNVPWRLPVVLIGYWLTLYTPQMYLILNKLRHLTK